MRTSTAVLTGLLLAACGPTQEQLANGEDPIAALESTVKSSRYGSAYWREQSQGETETWQEALSVCASSERVNYPNCQTVRMTAFVNPEPIEDPRTMKGFSDF